MFQFSGLALFRVIHLQCTRLSHSEIFGLMLVCSYPKLIAAYHVLHRLLVPRHPPCALIRFKYCITCSPLSGDRFKLIIFFLTTCSSRFSAGEQKLLSQYVKELENLKGFVWCKQSWTAYGPGPVHLKIITHLQFKKVEDIGVEPMTLCVQGRCSSQLS